jgi:hypothetical protein
MENLEIDGGRGEVVDLGRRGDWMQTWTGVRFYPEDPRKADVDILDIAFALGNISRYGGHCRYYSVAEHSILVSRMVPEHLALEGLMHDAIEAYIGDMIRPMKRAVGPGNAYFSIERNVRRAIAAQFGLAEEIPEAVLIADVQIVGLEKLVLHPRSNRWVLPYGVPEGLAIDCLPPRSASLAFLRRYSELVDVEYPGLEAVFCHLWAQDDLAIGQQRMQ